MTAPDNSEAQKPQDISNSTQQSQAYMKELLANPQEFSNIILSQWDQIDRDGLPGLSLTDLDNYSARSDVDPKTKAAIQLLEDHFDDIQKLQINASQGYGSTPPDNNQVTKQEINDVGYLSSSANVKNDMQSARSDLKFDGKADVVGGAGMVALGAGIDVLSAFAIPETLGWSIAGFAGGSSAVGGGIYEIKHGLGEIKGSQSQADANFAPGDQSEAALVASWGFQKQP